MISFTYGQVRTLNDQLSLIDDNVAASIVDWVASELSPEDVFDNEILEEWALENGMIKEDDSKEELELRMSQIEGMTILIRDTEARVEELELEIIACRNGVLDD